MLGQQNDKYTEMHGQQNFKKKNKMFPCYAKSCHLMLLMEIIAW
jgi:hypothetical protein